LTDRNKGQPGARKAEEEVEGRTQKDGEGPRSQAATMAAATSANDTGRLRTADSVVSLLPAPCSLLTRRTISCDPSSRIEPCCSKAVPSRNWAEPTSLRPSTSTSPPTDVAKQGLGWSRVIEGGR